MIKTRLCLPNLEARKIDCSYAYSAQEGSTETCTSVSAASAKVDFSGEYLTIRICCLISAFCQRDYFTDVIFLLSLLLVYSISECGTGRKV